MLCQPWQLLFLFFFFDTKIKKKKRLDRKKICKTVQTGENQEFKQQCWNEGKCKNQERSGLESVQRFNAAAEKVGKRERDEEKIAVSLKSLVIVIERKVKILQNYSQRPDLLWVWLYYR